MQPIRRLPSKQRSRGPKETNTKSRFCRIERRTFQKSTQKCGGSKYQSMLTYQKKLEDLTELGTDSMDPHTTYHTKGDVIWALGPKAKHEIMRGQLGEELRDISLQEPLKVFKKTFQPTRNVFHSRAQFFNIR